jgi:uncharacterized membrane protein SpoIIM required for sporulation
MDLTTFLQRRRPDWRQLEELLQRVEGSGLSALDEEEAVAFGRLYRRAASDLNQAQTFVRGEDTVRYLNDLVARAYLAIHGRQRLELGSRLLALVRAYPAIFRRHLGLFLAVTAIFLAGTVAGWLVSRFDPVAARTYLLPAEMSMIEPRGEDEADPTEKQSTGQFTAFSSFLFTHNLSVTLATFALGVTFGIGTVWLLFANGLMLGVLGAVFAEQDQLRVFATGILPHGVLEIPACLLGGTAGLLLAGAMIRARPWPRREELARQGAEALRLLAGCVPLLVAAAVLEAGVARAPDWAMRIPWLEGSTVKLLVASIVGLSFLAWLILGGRRLPAAEGAPA